MIEYSVQGEPKPSRPPLDIGAHVYAWFTGSDGPVKKNWDFCGYPEPWGALKPRTIKEKLRLGYQPVADQTRTGTLENDARNPGTINYGATEIHLIISQNRYAGAHQHGRANMIARPPYQVAQRDLDLEAEALVKAILESEGFA